VVLYELLAGQLPFKGDYEAAVTYAIVNEAPDPIQKFRHDLSSELLHVLNRTLEKDTNNRYQNINDLLIDLKRVKRDTDQSRQSPVRTVSDSEKKNTITKVKKGYKNPLFIIPFLVTILIIFSLIIYLKAVKPSQQSGDRIKLAVADIKNETGVQELDALSEPLITALEISRRLSVMTRSRIYDVAQMMGKRDIERFDEMLCRDVCKHAKVKILVLPSIRKIGNRYSLDLKIEDIEQNEYLYTDGERFEKLDNVFEKIDELAARIRKNLKETNRKYRILIKRSRK